MMIPFNTLITVVGLVFVILGFISGIQTYKLRADKELKSEASRHSKIETKLDLISKIVSDLDERNREQDRQLMDISKFIIRIDERYKQQEKQLDKGYLNGKE